MRNEQLRRENFLMYLSRGDRYRLMPLELEIPGYKKDTRRRSLLANEKWFENRPVVRTELDPPKKPVPISWKASKKNIPSEVELEELRRKAL